MFTVFHAPTSTLGSQIKWPTRSYYHGFLLPPGRADPGQFIPRRLIRGVISPCNRITSPNGLLAMTLELCEALTPKLQFVDVEVVAQWSGSEAPTDADADLKQMYQRSPELFVCPARGVGDVFLVKTRLLSECTGGSLISWAMSEITGLPFHDAHAMIDVECLLDSSIVSAGMGVFIASEHVMEMIGGLLTRDYWIARECKVH